MNKLPIPLLVLLTACGDASVSEDRLTALEQDLAALQQDKEALDEKIAEIDAMNAEISQLRSELDNCLQTADLDGYATLATTEALDNRLAAVEDAYVSEDALSDMDYATQSSVDDLIADIADLNANDATLSDRIDAIEDDYLVTEDIADVTRFISTDTIRVVTSATDLAVAWTELGSMRIHPEATYTLSLEATAYNFEEPLVLNHPDGARIRVEGAGTDATLLYFPDSDGIIIDKGHALGYLGELRIMGGGSTGNGLAVTDTSSLNVGSLQVQTFGVNCVQVSNSSSLVADDIVEVSGCAYGFYVAGSAMARLPNALAHENVSYGFYADFNGSIYAEGSAASANGNGYCALYNGFMWARYTTAEGNSTYGYRSGHGSSMEAGYSSASGNGDDGYAAIYSSSLIATSSDSTGNGDHGYNAANFSYVHATTTTASGNTGYGYNTAANSFIWASGAAGDASKDTDYNDTTDFIYGL